MEQPECNPYAAPRADLTLEAEESPRVPISLSSALWGTTCTFAAWVSFAVGIAAIVFSNLVFGGAHPILGLLLVGMPLLLAVGSVVWLFAPIGIGIRWWSVANLLQIIAIGFLLCFPFHFHTFEELLWCHIAFGLVFYPGAAAGGLVLRQIAWHLKIEALSRSNLLLAAVWMIAGVGHVGLAIFRLSPAGGGAQLRNDGAVEFLVVPLVVISIVATIILAWLTRAAIVEATAANTEV